MRFKQDKPLKTKAFINLTYRTKFYVDNFHDSAMENLFLGGSGISAMIMVYDALLDCDGKWEKLVCYTMLQIGDCDTLGAIAGGIYGAMYGKGDVPQYMTEHIELGGDIKKITKKLIKVFG